MDACVCIRRFGTPLKRNSENISTTRGSMISFAVHVETSNSYGKAGSKSCEQAAADADRNKTILPTDSAEPSVLGGQHQSTQRGVLREGCLTL